MEGIDRYGNLQKYLNPNPIQQWLLRRFHRRILELVRKTGARRILDVGCGEGFTMRELREDNNLQAAMIGVDLSLAALAWNRAREMSRSSLGVADVHHLPFSDDSFDLVLCLEVLEHLSDSAFALQELLRIARDCVLVSVPHEPLFRGANLLRGKHIRTLGNNPEHLQNYSGVALRRLLADHTQVVWHGYSFPWQIALVRKTDRTHDTWSG
jgi:SAM-dependent methyltransferase